ncbi:hypothetical protein, partial [Paenibacillus sp. FSL R7-0337]|uniref:hypothetical protein n=1 Tax=Paenibacillus sp. FSL R7-0337 TaxID=1926588 RepID=UPI001C4C1C84
MLLAVEQWTLPLSQHPLYLLFRIHSPAYIRLQTAVPAHCIRFNTKIKISENAPQTGFLTKKDPPPQ